MVKMKVLIADDESIIRDCAAMIPSIYIKQEPTSRDMTMYFAGAHTCIHSSLGSAGKCSEQKYWIESKQMKMNIL